MAEGTSFPRAVAALDMPPRRYVFGMLLPTAVGSSLVAALLLLALPQIFTGLFAAIPVAVPILAVGLVLAYPMQVAQEKRHLIDHNMHYFITHLGVLATSRVPPVDLFTLLGRKEDEYGPLAEECRKIATLVTRWNLSLAQAARFTAHRTPSILFGDFLERFAFAIESGADIGPYLKAEQAVVMADYGSIYRASLREIENLNGLYNGLMMTVIFLVIFALLMPVLVGGSATLVLLGVLGATVFLQVAFLLLVHTRAPPDRVWADLGPRSPLWKRVRWPLPVAVLVTAVLAPVLVFATHIPEPFIIALAATPLAVPGLLAGREEAHLKRRDDNYPAFVRTLGASTSARGGDAREVLRHLRHHDFGPLTTNVQHLFHRLQVRIDDREAWRFFTTEAGSRLVERFTRMYEEGIETGGRPDVIGVLISDNMVEILGLRKIRYQGASGFRGTLYGIAAAMAFSLFIGVGVLAMLAHLFDSLPSLQGSPVAIPSLLHTQGLDVPLLGLLVLGLLVLNSAFSALLVRFVDGGSRVRSLADFTAILWVSMATAYMSQQMLAGLLHTTTLGQ